MFSQKEFFRRNLKHNAVVNILDGTFFGLGWGFGSLGTIVTLFVSRMTHSAILIGLIPAIHTVGWQLPQLFMANMLTRLRRYKPLVMWMTLHERLPFIGLALVALFLSFLGTRAALVLTFLLLVWQGLGSGVTANGWQSMMAKIIPAESRGTFFGIQGAGATIMMSVSAILSGLILEKLPDPYNFALCFALTVVALGISYIFIGATRESVDNEKTIPASLPTPWKGGLAILRADLNFTAFLVVRLLTQFAMMGLAFYIIYGVRRFSMSDLSAGLLTATLTITETVANGLMGWLGDRLGHRWMLIAGTLSLILSSLIAWLATSLAWMYPAFVLAGIAYSAYWTIGIAFTVEFGTEENRPTYIGLANTLLVPFTVLAPLLGGWIAEGAGFQVTFILSAVAGLMVTAILLWLVRDPRPRLRSAP